MSGHSKWAKIKHKKGANDAKRGALFTKLGKNISLAAKEGGGDINMNFNLRLAVDKAKQANMPSANIEKAINKGSGIGEKFDIQRISYEALGVGGASMIIDCQTDNTNRTVAEVKRIIESNGGKFASVGSVSWKFEEKGSIIIALQKREATKHFGKEDIFITVDLENAEMEIMEIEGVEDIVERKEEAEGIIINTLEITTLKTDFSKVLSEIEKARYKVIFAELIKVAKDAVGVDEVANLKNEKLVELLDESEDVDSVWIDY